ncbi:PqqD family protein [bacterium]|nr:PqqD family protein [bacterium]
MAFRRRKPELSREQSLASVPLRNTAVREEETDEGFVRLVIPRRDSLWVRCMAKVFYVPKARRVTLDEIGTFVWRQCDGAHNVRSIIKALCTRYKLHRKEAEVSVVTYLRQLAKRGLLGIAVLKEGEKKK